MISKTFTANAIADLIGLDRRSVMLRLGNVPPDGNVHGRDVWSLRTFWLACENNYHPTRTNGKDDVGYASYNAERAKFVAEKARLAELDRKQREGELALVSDFKQAATAICNEVRIKMLAIPTRVGAQWSTVRSATEAQALVKKEIYAALTALARFDTPARS